jgi:hypothetical protein
VGACGAVLRKARPRVDHRRITVAPFRLKPLAMRHSGASRIAKKLSMEFDQPSL